jgi:hypothetical protein
LGARGVLLRIKKLQKVGKHNALSGNTASGRTGSAYDGECYTTPRERDMRENKFYRGHILRL